MSLLPCPECGLMHYQDKGGAVDLCKEAMAYEIKRLRNTRPTPAPLDGEPVRPEDKGDYEEFAENMSAYADKLLALRQVKPGTGEANKEAVEDLKTAMRYGGRIVLDAYGPKNWVGESGQTLDEVMDAHVEALLKQRIDSQKAVAHLDSQEQGKSKQETEP